MSSVAITPPGRCPHCGGRLNTEQSCLTVACFRYASSGTDLDEVSRLAYALDRDGQLTWAERWAKVGAEEGRRTRAVRSDHALPLCRG